MTHPVNWWVSCFWWKPLEDVCNLNVVIPDFHCSWVHWQEPNSTWFPLNQEIPKQKKQFRPFWWGFSFRVFPSSYETCDLVTPRMQAGLSSPHFDELRMETLGSPLCWGFQGMAMKNWNQWNHRRDSRNCCCFFSLFEGSCPKNELKLSRRLRHNIMTLGSSNLWAVTEAPGWIGWNDFLVSCLFKSTN